VFTLVWPTAKVIDLAAYLLALGKKMKNNKFKYFQQALSSHKTLKHSCKKTMKKRAVD